MKYNKICSKCLVEKPLSAFHKRKESKIGVVSACKECSKEKQQKWRAENPEKAKQIKNKWNRKNPNYQKEYYKKNAEKIIKRSEQWVKNNHDRKNEINKEWAKKNPDKAKKWAKENPEKVKEIKVKSYKKCLKTVGERKKQRLKIDLKFKLNHNISNNLRKSLKGNKAGCAWENLLGFTINELREHLEKLFYNCMTWDSFLKGDVHIDHKIPLAAFNFTRPEDEGFKKAWALKNLQPLWAIDNLKKGTKLMQRVNK